MILSITYNIVGNLFTFKVFPNFTKVNLPIANKSDITSIEDNF